MLLGVDGVKHNKFIVQRATTASWRLQGQCSYSDDHNYGQLIDFAESHNDKEDYRQCLPHFSPSGFTNFHKKQPRFPVPSWKV